MEETEKISQEVMRRKDVLSRLPKSPLITAPKNIIKSIILDAIVVALSIVSGMFFSDYINNGAGIILPLCATGLFIAFSVLDTLLTKSMAHRVPVIILETLGFLVPFSGVPLNFLGIALAVIVALLFWGEYLSREDAENSVEIRFFRVIKRPLSKMLTAIAIVGVILYLPSLSKTSVFISRPTFDSIFGWSIKFAGGLYPEYRLDSDLGTFANSVAKYQLQRRTDFMLLPNAIKEKTLNDVGEQILANLSKFFGFTLNSRDTFSDAIYAFLNKSLAGLKQNFGATFLTVWGVAIFLFVRSLATLFGFLVSLVSFLIYHALIAFEVIRVRTENKPHEVVEFF